MDVKSRVDKLRAEMASKDIGLSIITDHENMFYFTSYKAIIYSRPIMVAITMDDSYLIVPGLEEDHAKAHSDVGHVYTYYEHPEKVTISASPYEYLDKIMAKLPAGLKVGLEYSVSSLAFSKYFEEKGREITDIGPFVFRMRYIKSAEELAMMENASKLVSEALRVSINKAHAGVSEMEMDGFGNAYLMEETPKLFPDATLDIFVMSPGGLARTNMPHVFSGTRKYAENEIVLHSRQVGLNGYRAEIERTFFIGKPSEKQKEIFKVMTEAQANMLANIKPGMTAGEADALGRSVIQKAGYGEYSNHRCGHGIGLGLHENPYLRFDNDLVLEENMTFSIEPGIYIPELGGFRHSDTVILTKGGNKKITSHPSTLAELTFD